MKKVVRSYIEFTGKEMAKEFASTMQIIRADFKTLDDKVFEIIKNKDKENVHDILDKMISILEPFVDNMQEMLKDRVVDLKSEKRPMFVSEMSRIVSNVEDELEGLILIDELMCITMKSFDTYFEMCMEYACDRVST